MTMESPILFRISHDDPSRNLAEMAPTWPDVGQLEEDRSAGDARMRTDVPVMTDEILDWWIGGLVDW